MMIASKNTSSEKEFDRNCIKSKQKLAKMQNYKCPICRMNITDFSEKLVINEKVPAIHGRTRKYNNLQLVVDIATGNMIKCFH